MILKLAPLLTETNITTRMFYNVSL